MLESFQEKSFSFLSAKPGVRAPGAPGPPGRAWLPDVGSALAWEAGPRALERSG